jgi:CPA2 family monovalent cation:H+ antiporter-2
MGHLPKLIEDLALILMVGAFVTLLFKKIKQPLVLGYIIAGFLVGPHFHWLPTVVDTENIDTLSEIGVIFLLFSLGLEFSFKKLMRVGGAASITAFVEIIFITIAGFFVGRLLGWKTMDSLFLGGMLASSSTTIILRAFDELGVKGKKFAGIVFGVLVVEDIVVILLMVLLSTIAVTNQFAGTEILMTVLKLLFFLALWFITGIFLLPTFLKKAKSLLDEETLLILSIGLCLGMVVLATQVGFSAELGAFVMGSIIAETTSAEKVEHLIKPVKDLFGTVFFVSVGMMIDPSAMVKYGGPIIVITLLTLVGKMVSTTMGAILSGQPLKQSVQVGMSMAQIGEFAFIVATLGLSLGVISDFLFPIAVGASAITTFTTPYLIKFSEPFYRYLSRVLPQKWVNRINSYSSSTETIVAETEWKSVLKNYGKLVLINSIILLAILLLAINFLAPFIQQKIADKNLATMIIAGLTLLTSVPFFWAIMARKPAGSGYRELWMNKQYNHGPLLTIEVVRILIGTLLVGLFIDRLISAQVALMITIPVMIALLFIFSTSIQKFYQKIESRFMTNLNERETAVADGLQPQMSAQHKEMQTGLAAWDAHIVEMVVNPFAPFAGKTLSELAWREQYGINLAYIKRGDKIVHIPHRHNRLLPYDRAGILATDEQLAQFKPVFDSQEPITESTMKLEDVSLQQVMVDEITRLKGKTIRSSGIREKTEGLVVGVERNNERILNPDSSMQFEWHDIIWIVGNRKKIENFREGQL